MQDARIELERLPSENLYDIARNTAATHRLLAIQVLVERASPFAGRDEIAAEARQFILSNPIILKRIDPAAAAFATKLPGVVDCIADGQTKHIDLARVVDEHHAVHTQKTAALETTVNENKAASGQAIAEAYAVLWRDYTRKVFQLKLDHDNEIAELRAVHQKAIARLALLERSVWRKLVDRCHVVASKLRAWRSSSYPFPFSLSRLRQRRGDTTSPALQ
jgi:hypothetical protein